MANNHPPSTPRIIRFSSSTMLLPLVVVALVVSAVVANPTGPIDDFTKADRQFRKPISCVGRENGNYVWGCSRAYSACSNGVEHPKLCQHSNLVLNPETDQCQLPKDTPICTLTEVKLYKTRGPFKCESKPNGLYEAGPCSNFYYECHDERRHERECPAGLVFNPASSTCDYRHVCRAEAAKKKPGEGRVVPSQIGRGNATADSNSTGGVVRRHAEGGGEESAASSFNPRRLGGVRSGGPYLQPQVTMTDAFSVPESDNNPAPVEPSYQKTTTAMPYNPAVPATTPQPTPSASYQQQAPPASYQQQQASPVSYQQQPPSAAPTPGYNAQQPAPSASYQQQAPSANYQQQPHFAAPTPGYNTQQQQRQAPAFNCAGKPSGAYVAQPGSCNDHYWMCSHSMAHQQVCPHGLFYDIDNHQCNYRQFISACGGSPQPTTTTAQPKLPQQATYSAGAATAGRQAYQHRLSAAAASPVAAAAVNFVCAGKPDGLYAPQQCQPNFISCGGGRAQQLSCPDGTVFDTNLSSCAYPNECGKPSTSIVADASQKHGPPGYYSAGGASMASSASYQQGSAATSVYAQKASAAPVPSPSPYSAASSSAQPSTPSAVQGSAPYSAPMAGGVSSTSYSANSYQQQQQSYQQGSMYTSSSSAASPPPATAGQVNFNCAGKANGFYTNQPCQPHYFSCVGGHAHQLNCPAGTVYDALANACDFPSLCGKPPPQSATTTAAGTPTAMAYSQQSPAPATTPASVAQTGYYGSTTAPQQYSAPSASPSGQSAVSSAPVAPVVASYNCAGKQDGVYLEPPNACSPHFWKCAGGHSHVYNCPPGLYYNIANNGCDYKAAVQNCGSSTPPTQPSQPVVPSASTPAAGGGNSASNYQQHQSYQQRTGYTAPSGSASASAQAPVAVAQVKFNCAGKANGFYTNQPCQPHYFSCVGGHAHQLNCPAGTVYDTLANACDFPSLCGKPPPQSATTTAAGTPTAMAYSQQSPAPTTSAYQPPTATSPPVYPSPTQPAFSPPPPPPSQPPSSSYPQANKVLHDAPQQPSGGAYGSGSQAGASQSGGGFSCAGKANGNYPMAENACSQIYYSCSNSAVHNSTCPQNLFYDTDTKQCNYKGHVAACGGTPRPKPPPLSASQQQAAPPTPAPVEFSCAGKDDHYYAKHGCQPSYYACTAGFAMRLECPTGLVFDFATQECTYTEQCGKLGARNNQPQRSYAYGYGHGGNSLPTTAATPAAPAASSSAAMAQATPTAAAPYSTPAAYAAGQATTQQQQQYGAAEASSPPPTVYQPTQAMPAASASAVGPTPGYYGATSTAPQASANAYPPQPAGYSTPSSSPPSGSVGQPQEFSCSGKPDGIYLPTPTACVSSYWKCSNGNAYNYTCPASLYYNSDIKGCDYKAQITNCGGTPAATTIAAATGTNAPATNYQQPAAYGNAPVSTPPPQAVSSNSCVGKIDGRYYTEQPCQPHYYACVGGQAQQLNCPTGTVFDPVISTCDYPAACGNPRPTPSAAPPTPLAAAAAAPSHGYYSYDVRRTSQQQQQNSTTYGSAASAASSTPTPPAKQVGFNCAGLRDGYYYIKACSPSFFSCSNGHVSKQSCPAGLVFDPTLVACQHPPECGKPKKPTYAPQSSPASGPIARSYGSAAAYGSVQASSSSSYTQPSTPKASSGFDCSGKADGYYPSHPCSNTVHACSAGQAIPLTCPPTLVYDEISKRCEFPNVCGRPQPTPQPTTTTPTPQQQYSNNNYGHPSYAPPVPPSSTAAPYQQQQQGYSPTPSTQETSTTPTLKFHCQGRKDGYYIKRQCSALFYTCVGGHPAQFACPGTLLFDTLTGNCEYPHECGKLPPPPSSSSSHNYGYNNASSSSTTTPAPSASFQCAGKANGFYELGNGACQKNYVQCSNGHAHAYTCPATLVFNKAVNMCDYAENCRQQSPPTSSSSSHPNSQPQPAAASSSSASYSGSSNYHPVSLQPTPYRRVLHDAHPPPQQQQQKQQHQMVYKSVNRNCGNYSEGNHPLAPCSHKYVTCWYGHLVSASCLPEGTTTMVYNPTSGFCDFASNVAGCKATAGQAQAQQQVSTLQYQQQAQQVSYSTAAQTPSAATTSGGYYQKPQPMTPSAAATSGGYYQKPQQTNTAPAKVSNWCAENGKSNGIYSQGCHNAFISCNGGQTVEISCPVGLSYDHDTLQCDWPSVIVACGGKKPKHTSPSPRRPIQPIVYQKKQPLEFDCSQHPTGSYSHKCSSRYYSCNGGQGFALECPADLKYSQESGRCDYPANVPECGGRVPTTPKPYISGNNAAGSGYGAVPVTPQTPVQLPVEVPIEEAPYAGGGGTQQPPHQQQNNKGPVEIPAQPGGNPCDRLDNGIYGRPCSRYYFVCSGHRTYDFVCPDSQAFNVAQSKCWPSEQVESCQSQQQKEHVLQNNNTKPSSAPPPPQEQQQYRDDAAGAGKGNAAAVVAANVERGRESGV